MAAECLCSWNLGEGGTVEYFVPLYTLNGLVQNSIMACTRQCATDYLKYARGDLVTRLQNFPLITENLCQHKVFNDHDVDALKAERTDFDKARFILDRVIKRGESASYELLRILDVTRKRTLHPDSHTWLSQFHFREDTETDYTVGTKPCHNYQKQLQTKAKRILSRRWNQCCKHLKHKTSANVTFIPLVLDTDPDLNSAQNTLKKKTQKCKKPRGKKLKSYIPVKKQNPSPKDLLCSHKKATLVIGKPGIGKTAVVQEMLSLWSNKDNQELDYMFYFDESTFTTISSLMSLESLLFDMYSKPLEKDRKEVLQDIEENSENVIIVLDGISTLQDNPTIKKIIERDLLPEAKIVITCKSEEEDDFLFADRSTCRVYVQGFSEEAIQTYFTQMIGSTPQFLNIVLNNQDLISLCHVPMYAFMVAVYISFNVTAPEHPMTVTEMYVHILRQDLKKAGKKSSEQVDKYINDVKDQLFCLMKTAFTASIQKTINITDAVSDEIEISKFFLRKITIENTPTSVNTFFAFLHSTMQEFFSALWLLGNPGEIDEVLQNCLTKEQKHMKHVIPFLCGILSEQNLKLLKNLFSEDQIKRASDGLFSKVMNTFLQPQSNGQLEGDDDDVGVLPFVCQCLYESQSPEACLLFLEKVNYELDFSGEDLDPHQCCAVSYVIGQSRESQVHLSLEDCSISNPGIQMILKFKSQLRDKPSTLCHVWTSVLCCGKPRDFPALLDVCGKEMHLPVFGKASMFRKAGEIMSQSSEKISLHLHCTEDPQISKVLCIMVFKGLPFMKSLRFEFPCDSLVQPDHRLQIIESYQCDLILEGAETQQSAIVSSVLRFLHRDPFYECDFLIKLYLHVRNMEKFIILKNIYSSLPDIWYIDLSERKALYFLEVLKLQTVKKPVVLRGWSDEKSEVRSFLQCLPYISQLSFSAPPNMEESSWRLKVKSLLLKLCVQAALYENETVHTVVQKVLMWSNNSQNDFLMDLYSYVKDYEAQTGRSVFPVLQPLYESFPVWYTMSNVWSISLSERKASHFLEALKVQTTKKPVNLWSWSDEESEVRSFLQCLPYISQLRFSEIVYDDEEYKIKAVEFLLKLIVAAAECDAATGESFTKLLTSVCSYTTFPVGGHDENYSSEVQCDFLAGSVLTSEGLNVPQGPEEGQPDQLEELRINLVAVKETHHQTVAGYGGTDEKDIEDPYEDVCTDDEF
ncbi:uncharacterized protein LOC113568400 [Electrophorus electricus]|uniref:uncharacterized protein LOC113568400 n=1 Tax=Electrophorus electricus TaxID=8005 RepID=UPI0015D0022C|nr:uncharacterized protein LOC113568400 [Electrophorus electricus]